MVEHIVPIGTTYPDRESVRLAGLHKHPMSGIGYEPGGAAESIVVSGGYTDDQDFGNRLIYTGQGGQSAPGSGKQVRDQKVERGNRALINSVLIQNPIRIIRGSGGDSEFSPESGYRYDGLFLVTKHWFDKSSDGPLIIRFELVKYDFDQPLPPKRKNKGEVDSNAPAGNENPNRIMAPTAFRIERDPKVPRWIKKLYQDECQICRTTLLLPSGKYSQGAHIQGLGDPHLGPDTVENMLCLCANCHILFDNGVFYIEKEGNQVVNLISGESRSLLVNSSHNISDSAIAHHKLHIAGIKE